MEAKQPSRITLFTLGVVAILVFVASVSMGYAQTGMGRMDKKFVAGVAGGLHIGTPDDAACAFALYGDYYLTRELSVGPLFQTGFTRDFYHTALSAQARYTFDLPGIPKLKPHAQAGIGIIHGDIDQKDFRLGESDTSFIIPMGVGVEYKLRESIILDTAFLLNFTNLDVRDKRVFGTWLIGVKVPF
jgi:opacity protein-like surface antigen